MEKRKMGGERLFFRSPNINVCFKARIARNALRGNFSRDDFRLALDAATSRHPLTSCAVHLDSEGGAWYLPGKSKIGLGFFDGSSPEAWLEWYEKTDGAPFDFENGPLVKVGVFRSGDSMDIAVIGHHILGDGIGYLNLLRDALSALDGKLDATAQIVPERAGRKKKTRISFLPALFAKSLNRSWRKTAKIFSHDDYAKFFENYRQGNPPGMYLGLLEGSKLAELLAACKKLGVTVNEAISAAFVAALQSADPRYATGQTWLGCAASIRGELEMPAHDCMGNFVTGIAVQAHYDGSKPFAENAKAIGLKLREKLADQKSRYLAMNFLGMLDSGLIESAVIAAHGGSDNRASKKLGELLGECGREKGIGVSNLGKQSAGEYENFTVSEITFVPPAFPANLINIGVMTAREQMRFCLRYSRSNISDEAVRMVYLEAVELLARL